MGKLKFAIIKIKIKRLQCTHKTQERSTTNRHRRRCHLMKIYFIKKSRFYMLIIFQRRWHCVWWNVHCEVKKMRLTTKLWGDFERLTFAENKKRVKKNLSVVCVGMSSEGINWNRFLMLFQLKKDEIKLIGITVKSLFSLIAVRARGAIKFNKKTLFLNLKL